MNDCLWYRMGICDQDICPRYCERYMSMNSFEGGTLLRNYKEDVNDALDPVKRKWRTIYEMRYGEQV